MLLRPKTPKNQQNFAISSAAFATAPAVDSARLRQNRGGLGNTTKGQAKTSPKAIKITTENNDVARRNQVYKLQNISADTLRGELFRNKPSRVCSCCHARSDKSKPISIRYDEEKEKANYANLMRCGSVWVCPICARTVSEVRRDELLRTAEYWSKASIFDVLNAKNIKRNFELEKNRHKLKMKIYLVTLTVRHSKDDELLRLKEGLTDAFDKLNGNRTGRQLWAEFGKVHHIRGLEVTWGLQNGWHPHLHVLVFSLYEHSNEELSEFKKKLGKEWQNCCVESGLKKPTIQHGIDIQDGSYAATYINKFGEEIPCRGMGDKLDLEMTKSHMKRAKEKDRFTPFEMLEHLDEMPMLKHKFREYSHAFFGAIQLNYSRGLKNLVRISDLTDDEVVELKENEKQEKVEVFTVNKSLFDILYINKLRGEFLAQVERDIKKDGLDSEFKYTNDFIKNAVSDVFGKLETALQKTDQSNIQRIGKIQDRIISCINILQNPVKLENSQSDNICDLFGREFGGYRGAVVP
jgi:hypothetical protein